MEGLYWHPGTIQIEIEQDAGAELPAGNYDRLMTAINLVTTNNFFKSVPDFCRACVTLSGHHPTPNLMVLPDASDLAWGITEGMLIMPPEEGDDEPFTQEILGYISQAVKDEGIINPPDVLKLGGVDQGVIARISYDWSDDPDFAGAIWKNEQDKTNDITRMIRGRMKAMAEQLAQLPLQVGRTKDLVQKILANIPNADSLPLPI